jgi:hypothetical protein
MVETPTATKSLRGEVKSRREAGFMLIDVLIGIIVMALILMFAMMSLNTMRERRQKAAGTDSTVVAVGDAGFTFPWGTVIAVVGLALVVAWLFLMAKINQAKAEASAAAWLNGDDATDVAETASTEVPAPVERTDDNPFALVTTADGTPLTPVQADALRDGTSGKRRSSGGGGFLDKVGEIVDLLS